MQPNPTRRRLLSALPFFGVWPLQAQTRTTDWAQTLQAARGRTVYFNAWAGSEQVNAYIQWAADRLLSEFGVRLSHVKISDAGDVVKRVRAEKAAGRTGDSGTVDLLWINGENFAAMKREGLLYGPWAEQLPHFAWVDTVGKPSTRLDFSVPTDGFEAPWGMAQLTFYADSKRLPQVPQSMAELLALAQTQKGRLAYPRPPDFHGTTFLKQALLETTPQRAALSQQVSAATFAAATASLWAFLDALHPHLWRQGRQFVSNASTMRQMVADGELLLGLTFNPNEAANEIASQRLSPTVQSWQFKMGTVGNTHFVAIPLNAKAKQGAQVVANFLLSPEAQAHKGDLKVWGDPTVLDIARLPLSTQALFAKQPLPGQVKHTAPTLPEPHASWVDPLEREWVRRYGV